MNIFYQPKNAWVGDLIPYYENGLYYAFYLHDPRPRPLAYAEQTTWHLATTKDFVHFEDQGEAIARGGEGDANRDIYTGSVIKTEEGRYYAFYTAFNPEFKVNGKAIQSVMAAAGDDPLHLQTLPGFRIQADGEMYESFDWRDPYVFWNEDEHCWWMLLAARIKGAGAHRGGCVGLCKSADLVHWEYAKPFYAPGMYITMECPEVFKMGRWWYLVFSTFSDRFVTHYRMAESLSGPWVIPPDDVFDNRANYAIKTAGDGQKRYAFGWIATKAGERDFGPWEWGGTMAVHELLQDEHTGHLRAVPTQGLREHFQNSTAVENWKLYNATPLLGGETGFTCETLGAALCEVPDGPFSMQLTFTPGGHEFGLCLHTDAGLENGYFLRIDPAAGLMAWDQWPRTRPGAYQWQIDGDVGCMQETARRIPKTGTYRLRVVREGSICVVYLNDEVALSARMYDHSGGLAGPYAIQGRVNIEGCSIGTNNG